MAPELCVKLLNFTWRNALNTMNRAMRIGP